MLTGGAAYVQPPPALRALFPFRVIFGKITGISHINVIFTPFYDRSPALGGEFMGALRRVRKHSSGHLEALRCGNDQHAQTKYVSNHTDTVMAAASDVQPW